MRHLYIMMCKQCNYSYQYEGEEYERETCPICGQGAPFNEFVEEVRLPPPLYDSEQEYKDVTTD